MKERILIVDDCVVDRKIAEKIFSKKYLCDFATTYSEAIDLIQNNHYDAILVDFYLETQDDDKVVEKINELRKYTNGSVFIVCSSNDDIAQKSNLNNVDHFISKKRYGIIPERIEQIKKYKKDVYQKNENLSKLLESSFNERK